jgi:hypothetical protein
LRTVLPGIFGPKKADVPGACWTVKGFVVSTQYLYGKTRNAYTVLVRNIWES